VNPRIKIVAISRMIPFLSFLVSLSFPCPSPAVEAERDTFSISLVQEATVRKDDLSGVPYERYTVKKHDYLWKILRDKGLIPGPNTSELLSAIKAMNTSLKNLDLIHPGQTILIPLEIVPKKSHGREVDEFFQRSVMGFSSLGGVNLENYVVKPGDNISTVVMGKYGIPPDYLYREYLDLVRRFNPTMKDLDLIYPNQVIRLPIYSPEIVRVPIERLLEQKPDKKIALKETDPPVNGTSQKHPKTLSLGRALTDIFDQIGEEWVDSGEQFIPLSSGGHVKLKADSFPTLNLRNGRTLIIDLHGGLPEDIARMIETDWESHKVVRVAPHDNLKAVLDKILAASGYHDVLRSGESLKLQSDIHISLAGDWVIVPAAGDIPEEVIAITLISTPMEQTPLVVKRYLKRLGVTVLDYPDFPLPANAEDDTLSEKIPFEKGSRSSLPTLLLHLSGQPFSSDVKIPVYKSGETGFSLIIHADLFFSSAGRDCIIDATGFSPDILELLTKHGFRVLTLAGQKNPCKIAELVLGFIDMKFDPRPHVFPVSSRDEARNIMLTLQGIQFSDKDNRKILATDTTLPDEIIAFLNQKGYYVLELGQPQD
jgi:hypothetical protein